MKDICAVTTSGSPRDCVNRRPDQAISRSDVVEAITFGLVPPDVSLTILALWECIIGLGLIFSRFLRATLLLLWLQMVGAILPLFLFPNVVFMRIPYAPSLEGQYIIKNLVITSASLVIGATVHGGRIVAEPGNDDEA